MPRKGVLSSEDVERLVELVRKNPFIYDPTRSDHMDAWKRIAELMGKDDVSAAEWKKHWKNLRDSYNRHRIITKDKKSGDAAKPDKKLVYADILSFLDQHVSENNTESNFDPLPDDENDENDSGGDTLERHDVIPIVMGAPPEDYERVAPYHSYIHVEDFDSPMRLADYLHKLNNDDNLYNEYFQWKGTGTFINTFYWCRLCAMLHDESHGPIWYSDVEEWWRGDGQCSGTDSWKEYRQFPVRKVGHQTLNGTSDHYQMSAKQKSRQSRRHRRNA